MDDLIMNGKSVGPSDATTNITEENTQTSGKIKTLKNNIEKLA